MKQFIVYLLIVAFAMAGLTGCTNDEGGEDLDVLTPADTTQSQVQVREF